VRSGAQIRPSIIYLGSVYVIDLIVRPFAGDNQPRDAMHVIDTLAVTNRKVSA
jgi:hypothetical protein